MKPKVVSVEFIMVQKRGVSQVELEFSSISLRVLDGLDRVFAVRYRTKRGITRG